MLRSSNTDVKRMTRRKDMEKASCEFPKRQSQATHRTPACTFCGEDAAGNFDKMDSASTMDTLYIVRVSELPHKIGTIVNFRQYVKPRHSRSPSHVGACKTPISSMNNKSTRFHPISATIFFIAVFHLLCLHFGSAAVIQHKQTLARTLLNDPTFRFQLPSNEFITRLAGIPSFGSIRRARSAPPCLASLQQLADLAEYAYLVATSGYEKVHMKRHAPRRMHSRRSWESTCLQTHEKVKQLICQSHRKEGLFGRYTDDLSATLKSISHVLQQEMNVLKQPYTSLMRSVCEEYPQYTGDSLRRKIINELYEMKLGLSQACH